jgi:predicted DNA binding CopG/RHH family protein
MTVISLNIDPARNDEMAHKNRLPKIEDVEAGKGRNMKKKPTPNETEVKMLTTRVPKVLIKRVKTFCSENEMTIQDFVTDAIIEKLERVYKERRKKLRL